MPRINACTIIIAALLYVLTAGVTLRDRLLIATLHRIERTAYFEPSARELFEGAMTGMIDVLSDEHGDYYSMYIPSSGQSDYQDELDNRYEGLGLALRIYGEGEEKEVFITYPRHNSPAHRAGLRSGSQIMQIDGTSLEDKSGEEILGLLRQNQKPGARLSVVPFGQTEPQEVLLHREKIQSDSVEGDYFDSDKRVFHLETLPKIGYIRITSFSTSTAKEFGDALDSMMQSGSESFVLDLRDNSGGDLRTCLQIARMLMKPSSETGNVIVTVRDRNGMKRFFQQRYTLIEGTQQCTLPMVVLIDGDTASSSEILAAALQDHRRATVVGVRSFGKGVIQSIVDLPFQSGMLQLTNEEYRRPSGGKIHRKLFYDTASDEWGIIPDKIVELSVAERSAVMEYRSLRSNVVTSERSAVLEQFRRRIVEESDSESEPTAFAGSAPYYDAQIEAAIQILLGTENVHD